MNRCQAHLQDGTIAIILLHGVIRRQRHAIRNYTSKHIALDCFARLMRDLAASGRAVSVKDILRGCTAEGPIPDRAYAITFDDGFENNFSVAAPVLKELGVPATFYVTSQFVDENAASWIDQIEHAVEQTPVVRLSLPQPALSGTFRSRDEKVALLERIRSIVKNDRSIDPYAFALGVRDQLGASELEPDAELDAKLSWRQVTELASDPLFDVGGHGHTHRVLSFLDAADLELEVDRNLKAIRSHVAGGVDLYSYPEGLRHCYSDAVIETLRRHGVKSALTAEPGRAHVGDDPFRMPRVWVDALIST